MKKSFLLKVTFMGFFLILFGQKIHAQELTLSNDTRLMEGTWLAIDGNKSFELTIKKELLYLESATVEVELLFGGIKYKVNGSLTRETIIDSRNSMIYGTLTSPTTGIFSIMDKEREISGKFIFNIDLNNPQKATWQLRRDRINVDGWTTKEFDIPTKLEWTKIE